MTQKIFLTAKALKIAELTIEAHSLAYQGDALAACHKLFELNIVKTATYEDYLKHIKKGEA